jgi:hypothetical protein
MSGGSRIGSAPKDGLRALRTRLHGCATPLLGVSGGIGPGPSVELLRPLMYNSSDQQIRELT